MQLMQIPAGLNDRACEIGSNRASLRRLDFEVIAVGPRLSEQRSRHTGDLFQALRDEAGREFAAAVSWRDLDGNCFRAAQTMGKAVDGVSDHHAPTVNDDDLLAGLLDLG